jgi:hypothetical protein
MRLTAYPNYSEYFNTGPRYDISKWMQTFRDIYSKVHFGSTKLEAINDLTKDWEKVEKLSFLNWLKYYESGDYLKYKQAQNNRYYVNDDLNYFLPNPISTVPSPIKSINDQMAAIPTEVKANPVPTQDDKRRIIEEQRKKILGRLNSVEKLLSSQQGQMFAGPEFEKLLHSIYELKKQIQTSNKISISAQTCVDLIIRQANILKMQGYSGASEFMVKFAQNTPGDFSFQLGDTPAGGSQPQGLGALDNNIPNPATLDAADPTQTSTLPSGTTNDEAISEFLENLEGSGITNFDDKNQAKDEIEVDEDVLLDQIIVPEDEKELVVEAQAMPAGQPIPPKPPTRDLEVEAPARKPDQKTDQKKQPQERNVDALVDSALANVSINDVVQELEEVSFIFKNREIVRKLSLVDMMMDKLNIAPFFSELSEVIQKNLESSNYSNTRLEIMLSRLRGNMDTYKTDLEEKSDRPESGLQKHFEGEENKEKQRKEMRKKLQDQELVDKSKPEATVEAPAEELAAQPVQVERPGPAAPPVR